jgi:intracellular sulfur oxidation DsrE/DsrF family protein
MKYIPLVLFANFITVILFSQTTPDKHKDDSIRMAKRDSMRMGKFRSMAIYPLINGGTMSGVLPVKDVDEIPDSSRDYKLLFEFTVGTKDTAHRKINDGLVEIARVINLHIASGIALSHIHTVVLIHGASIYSVLKNDSYTDKYKTDNPNLKLIDDIMKAGGKFVVCGQYMTFVDMKKEQLVSGIKLSLSAKTVLSNYLGQGYVLYDISEDKL